MQTVPAAIAPTEQTREDQTRFAEMIFPEQANHYGTLFGGHALNLMGKAAFITATRWARQNVVMAASNKIEFHEPIRVGELVELIASITRVGRSSMTVAVANVIAACPDGNDWRLLPSGRSRRTENLSGSTIISVRICACKRSIPKCATFG